MKVQAAIFLQHLQNLTTCKKINRSEIRYFCQIRMNLLSALYRAKGHKKKNKAIVKFAVVKTTGLHRDYQSQIRGSNSGEKFRLASIP